MLKKIFHVGGSKNSQETATIILHIVFKDQYHIYEPKDPFGFSKNSNTKMKMKNQDLVHVSDKNYQKRDSNENNMLRHVTPLKLVPAQFTERTSSLDKKLFPRSTQSNSVKPNRFHSRNRNNGMTGGKQSQQFVFIKVKDRYQYDLNPKLLKIFLSELLKDQTNRAKLLKINQKLENLSKDKVFKFGMQHYFDVMDEIVNMLEVNLKQEEEYLKSLSKLTSLNDKVSNK